jgi:hypothetical protein
VDLSGNGRAAWRLLSSPGSAIRSCGYLKKRCTHPDGGQLRQHACQHLVRSGEAYVNAAYGKSPVTLDIRVSGMGKLTLE